MAKWQNKSGKYSKVCDVPGCSRWTTRPWLEGYLCPTHWRLVPQPLRFAWYKIEKGKREGTLKRSRHSGRIWAYIMKTCLAAIEDAQS